jgi:hypothetical protein
VRPNVTTEPRRARFRPERHGPIPALVAQEWSEEYSDPLVGRVEFPRTRGKCRVFLSCLLERCLQITIGSILSHEASLAESSHERIV